MRALSGRSSTHRVAIVVATLAGLGAPAASGAQGVWEALLTIDPYPSPYYSDWEVDPAMGTLTVMNHGMAAGDVRVAFTIVDGSNRVIASGTSEPQRVPAGAAAIFDSPYEVAGTSRHDARIEEVAERTGRLPEGGYTACAAALDLDGFVLAEACAAFTILYPDPPLLLAPGDEAVVDRQDELFQWTPVQVPAAFEAAYVLRIVEVLDGQTPGEALESNLPHYEGFDLFTPTVQYPIEAPPFEAGKRYAWSVRAFDQNGYALSANEGRSEIWTFRYDDGSAPSRPEGGLTLTLLNVAGDAGPAAAASAPSGTEPGGLGRLCELWSDPPAAFALGLDVARGFARGEQVVDVELFQDQVSRSWALFGERSGRQYLVVGDCDLGGEDGGLRWIATSKPDRRQPFTEFLDWVVDRVDPDGVGDLVLEDGVIILAVRPDTARVPADWGRASAMLGGRSIPVVKGLTLDGVLKLPKHGAWSFFERLGYTEKELELRGTVPLEREWKVGASVEQPTLDSLALKGSVDSTAERTWVTLRAAFPRRPMRIATDFFEEVQWGVEIEVKSATKVEASTGAPSPSMTDTRAVEVAPFVELATVGGRSWKGELVTEGRHSSQPLRALTTPATADSTAKSDSSDESGFGMETPVLKLSSDTRLTLGRTGFTVGCPVIEVKVDSGLVNGLREGPSALDWSVKLEGALEQSSLPSVATLSLEIGRHATRSAPTSAGSGSKMDSIRANIARLEGELKAADDRGATAEGDRIARALAIERNALAMWEAQGRKSSRDSTAAPAERSPWHWTARVTQEPVDSGAGCSDAPTREVGLASLLAALTPPGSGRPALEIPSDFLDLEDVAVTADATGRIVATALTRVGKAYTRVLLAYEREGDGGVTVGLKPQRWSLTEAIPAFSGSVLDGVDFSNVALVVAQGEREATADELIPEEWAFYREVYQADDFSLTLRPGVNLIAAIPAAELGEGHPLTVVMDALGIETGVVLLQGTLGRSLGLIGGGAAGGGVIDDLYLRAELPPMRPPGSPDWFRSGQLALELTGDPSVRLVGEMTVNIEDDELLFFLAAAMARTGVSLSGGLAADEGWEQPFGIPWLVMNGVVVKVGVTPAGSVQLGFAGDMVIGEKDIAVAVAVALNAATGVPTNFIIEGESEAGFGLSDLVLLQSRMAAARGAAASALEGGPAADVDPAIPLDALPPVDFREVGLKFAPKPEPDLGVERGMAIRGRLWLPMSPDGGMTDFAGVDVAVSEDGLWVRGDLGAFELGPLVWQDAELDLTATRDDQHFLVKGEVELLGSRQLVDVRFARRSFSFQTETRIQDLFTADISAVSEFDLRNPAFQVDAVAHADFGDVVGPLVQEGVARFAESGEEALATARIAAEAADEALARSEATLAELRRVLDAQRRLAADARDAALADANRSRSTMNAARAARSRAYRAYRSTPAREVRLKARRLAAYRSAHRRYLVRAVAYGAVHARFVTADRVYRAIPPTDRRVAVMTASEAVARLREQLTTMRTNLTAMESQYRRITDVLAGGGQLLRIDRAEFHAGLEAAQRGEAVQWRIRGAFAEQPFEVEEVLDFSSPGAGAAGLVGALLYR